MIAVRLEGRLGNQLFQYAFVYTAAKKLGVNFYLDESIDVFLLDRYFDINAGPFHFFQKYIFNIRGYKNLFSYYLRRPFYARLKKIYNLRNVDFNNIDEPTRQLDQLADRAYYTGFFQSEEYFDGRSKEITKLFSIKPLYKKQYTDVAKSFPTDKTIVVIHIRRGDYIAHKIDLPESYYMQAIACITAPDPYYVFISDDPDHVMETFGHLKNKYVSRNSEIVDLQLLQNAKICILSNSTFSWWGAWLNNGPGKIVYAPKYFMGWPAKQEMPTHIYPHGWVQLDL